jgi:microcystin-dependent protein
MATYKSIVTTLGQAKIATAIANNSTVNLFEMAVGDGNGNAVTPTAGMTALVRERYRAQLNTLTVDPSNPNYVIAELVIPSSVGGWTVREVGVFDNSGALIVVANFPDTYKPVINEGSTRDLIVRIIIEVAEADALTLTIDPAVVLASRQWVSDNFSLAVQIPGGTTGQILRKASNAAGDVEWFDPVSGINIIVDVVEENQTLAASQTVVNLAVATTNGAVVYVDGVRLESSEWAATDADTITLDEAYPDGSRITVVQNEPLSSGDFLRTANRFSEIQAAGSPAQEAARVNLGLPANGISGIAQAVMQAIYRVGSLYITTENGNPNSLLGFGTWTRFGEGRAIVGFDAADSDFNAIEKIGGAKTHQLTTAELPAHTHQIDPPATNTSSNGDHSHTSTSQSGGGDTTVSSIYAQAAAYPRVPAATITNPETGTAGAHTHTVDIPAFTSGSTGSGQGHNNLQPYITTYLWKRTA